MLAQLVSVALTASVKATDTKSVSSFNHFLSSSMNKQLLDKHLSYEMHCKSNCSELSISGKPVRPNELPENEEKNPPQQDLAVTTPHQMFWIVFSHLIFTILQNFPWQGLLLTQLIAVKESCVKSAELDGIALGFFLPIQHRYCIRPDAFGSIWKLKEKCKNHENSAHIYIISCCWVSEFDIKIEKKK